jgi:hypothetical protein
MFAVIGFVALFRAPYRQLALCYYFFFGMSILLSFGATVITITKYRKSQGNPVNEKNYTSSSAWRTSAFSTSVLAVVLSILLGLFIDQMYDTSLRSHFDVRGVRLGQVSVNSVTVLIRDPTAKVARLEVENREKLEVPISGDRDHVSIIIVKDLVPNTSYMLKVSTDGQSNLPYFEGDSEASIAPVVLSVRTLPDEPSVPIRFAFGSCTLPFPYRHAMEGYNYISQLNPHFFVHLGGKFLYTILNFICMACAGQIYYLFFKG